MKELKEEDMTITYERCKNPTIFSLGRWKEEEMIKDGVYLINKNR